MKFCKKNLNTNFIRICRIQYNSKLRNQNLYFNHHYIIKWRMNKIYTPGILSNIKERIMDLFISNQGEIVFTNSSDIFIKKTTSENNSYIDIGYQIDSYDTNIEVEILTPNEGSIKFYCDKATIGEYTRLNFFGTNTNVLLHNGNARTFLAYNGNTNITISNEDIRITDMRNGNIAYITKDGDIRNGDNTSFTVTITSTTDYGKLINIAGKMNSDLLIENILT